MFGALVLKPEANRVDPKRKVKIHALLWFSPSISPISPPPNTVQTYLI